MRKYYWLAVAIAVFIPPLFIYLNSRRLHNQNVLAQSSQTELTQALRDPKFRRYMEKLKKEDPGFAKALEDEIRAGKIGEYYDCSGKGQCVLVYRRPGLKKVPTTKPTGPDVFPKNLPILKLKPTSRRSPTPGLSTPRVTPNPPFDHTVVRRRIGLRVWDNAVVDGDTVTISVNGVIRALNLVLGDYNSSAAIAIDSQPGYNNIEIIAVSSPAAEVTIGLEYFPANGIIDGPIFFQGLIPIGTPARTTLGFPQIGISQSKYPQSAKHIVDSWNGIYSAGFRPPFPLNSPRLLTIDRLNKTARRTVNFQGISRPYCSRIVNGRRQQADEYPPATFVESASLIGGPERANLRCINAPDNEGSGSSFGDQMRAYRPRRGANTIFLDNTWVVEFIITP